MVRRTPAIAAAAALFVGAPAAHADIFAVSDSHPNASTGQDIAYIDVSTGKHLALPAGVNTGLDETRPTITTDGKRMVFLRTDSHGAVRVILVDLATGQSADLFNGFEVASHTPLSPAITPDGKTVFTGGSFRDEGGGKFRPYLVATDVTNFPSGPYPHTEYAQQFPFNANGVADDVLAKGSTPGSQVVYQARYASGTTQIVLDTVLSPPALGGPAPRSGPSGAAVAHPVLGAPGGSPVVVFDETGGPGDQGADIRFLATDANSFDNAAPARLPIDNPLDQLRPAFTPDGRYLAFVRANGTFDHLLFAWDSETQTLLSASGIDLGMPSDEGGSPSLFVRPVFTKTTISVSGNIAFNLLGAANVGIIVQRVVGHHKLFGRKVPTLKLVGRVPLGHFKKGHGKAHWNLRVKGKRLRKGIYQVTPRVVTKSLKIRDLGKPATIHVRG